MIHTQMTRLGDPMLDPGGEMEVSDVRLCCGREGETSEKLHLPFGGEGAAGAQEHSSPGTLPILVEVLSGYSSTFSLFYAFLISFRV